MQQTLILENMRFHAFHGVMPIEQKIGGEYTVSLKICYDFSKAELSDDMNDAIDYSKVYELVKHEMLKPSKLIENVARRIQDSIIAHFSQINQLETSISKYNPPFEGIMDKATVALCYNR